MIKCKNCKKEFKDYEDWGMMYESLFCSDECANTYKEKTNFICWFRQIQKEVYQTATEKGWWNVEREIGTQIALMHSELSEALEGIREDKRSDKIPEFLAIEEEFADVIIRIMDTSEYYEYRVAEALIAKMKYNKNREYRHGGKKF